MEGLFLVPFIDEIMYYNAYFTIQGVHEIPDSLNLRVISTTCNIQQMDILFLVCSENYENINF